MSSITHPQAVVAAIEYHLPERVLSNEELAARSSDWTADKIEQKTGIAERWIAAAGECASDLAARAAEKLFAAGSCERDAIDYMLVCTQSPDYLLPTTACLLQERLGLARTIGALDFNLGCSGFVYGLGLAKGLIETGQAKRVLLITAETYSKFLHEDDLHVRTLFGDGAAATLVTAQPARDAASHESPIGPFVYGTDGRGGANLIVEGSGLRGRSSAGALRLHMNGPEIFSFTLSAVPQATRALLDRAGLMLDAVDLVVFHQANAYMLEHLRAKLSIPPEKFWIGLRDRGNTVSSTVPIALKDAEQAGRLKRGDRVLLVGFGVGYSWGATLIRWGGLA